MVLGFPIARVEISKEKSVVYHPEYKGVRLDIYAQDEEQTCYNVEMQAASTPHLGKRSRYYHGQMDMDLLLSEETMRIFRRRMSFLSVTLIRLEIKNINIRSAISARRRARSILEMRGIPFS
ncbi:MAG: PD-(D/E)XK nuclease family transposase [Lachnospiraceae bacterium]